MSGTGKWSDKYLLLRGYEQRACACGTVEIWDVMSETSIFFFFTTLALNICWGFFGKINLGVFKMLPLGLNSLVVKLVSLNTMVTVFRNVISVF